VGIKYIINKQVGGAHSLMKNEAFKANSSKDIRKEEWEAREVVVVA
jgi:hypothetical protein